MKERLEKEIGDAITLDKAKEVVKSKDEPKKMGV